MNINFDGDLRTDSDEEEEEISDVGTVMRRHKCFAL